MITQYINSNGYSSVDSATQAVIANKISLLDEYVLMQTGEYEWTALVKNTMSKKTTKYTITRNSSGYSSPYSVSAAENADFDYNITNEYYVYSNVGQGRSLDLPVYDGVQSHALVIMCCALMFAIVFKGVLFRCLDSLRRR